MIRQWRMSQWYALDSTRVSVMVHIVAALTSHQYTSVTAMYGTADTF